jgi:hypothetical protein
MENITQSQMSEKYRSTYTAKYNVLNEDMKKRIAAAQMNSGIADEGVTEFVKSVIKSAESEN